MKKILILVAVLLITSVAFAQKNAELSIGFQGPETGPIAIYGLQTLAGVQLAVDEINAAGGINGKKVKLIHYDSRGDKTEAVSISKRLMNAKICALVGEPTSGAYFASRDVAERAKTPSISAGATAKGVTDGRPFIFRNTLLDSDGAPAIIELAMKEKGFKNFALITSVNNDYSVGLSDFFKDSIKKAGANIVAEQTISDGDTDLSAQITSLKSKNIDAVIFTGYYQEAALILLEMRKQGLNQILVGGDGFQSPEIWKIGKDTTLGTIFFGGFASNAPLEKVKKFNEKIEKRGVASDMFAAQGYDAANLFFGAMKNAKVTDCSKADQRDAIRKAMMEIKSFDGVSGEMSFDKEGNAIKKPFIQEIIKTGNDYTTKLLN